MLKQQNLFEKQKDVLSEHVVICVPTTGMVHSQFAYFLVEAIRYTEKQGIQVTLEMDLGTVLSNQRQILSDLAVNEYKAEHIMWLDSDMTFPEDVIIQLLKHRKRVICATYPKRVKPFNPTAFYNIDPVETVDTNEHGLVQIKYTGMGCMLVRAIIMDQIPSPHFPLKWHAPSSTWHGEDMGFCDLLYHNDIKIFCDLDLSRQIGHLGSQEFRVNQAN